jgi:hypothetical protein
MRYHLSIQALPFPLQLGASLSLPGRWFTTATAPVAVRGGSRDLAAAVPAGERTVWVKKDGDPDFAVVTVPAD